MRITVKEGNGLSYEYDGSEPLAVGDTVLCPENWVSRMKHGPGPFPTTVLSLESAYTGPCSRIIRKVTDL